jgi:hypothetical protein
MTLLGTEGVFGETSDLCCVIVPGLAFVVVCYQLSRLRRTVLFPCSICGKLIPRANETPGVPVCQACSRKVQIDHLSEEQRNAFSRPPGRGQNTGIRKEPDNQRGIVPERDEKGDDGIQL